MKTFRLAVQPQSEDLFTRKLPYIFEYQPF